MRKYTKKEITDLELKTIGFYLTEHPISKYREKTNASMLIITHYPHILKYIKPDYVHIMNEGTIVKTGDANLANSILENGYEASIMKEE